MGWGQGPGMNPRCLEWEQVMVVPNSPHPPPPSATTNDGAIVERGQYVRHSDQC